ncbi:hypothetical protein niasHS_006477 [Heterodera schachtii]|uniref:Orn/DAP/Arg decarboxylase 2 N-terminal domain-containing protein n=1 Tax=Heterodera schachtii TaxID=97005 RepID=A0ABD2JHH0_HETSC
MEMAFRKGKPKRQFNQTLQSFIRELSPCLSASIALHTSFVCRSSLGTAEKSLHRTAAPNPSLTTLGRERGASLGPRSERNYLTFVPVHWPFPTPSFVLLPRHCASLSVEGRPGASVPLSVPKVGRLRPSSEATALICLPFHSLALATRHYLNSTNYNEQRSFLRLNMTNFGFPPSHTFHTVRLREGGTITVFGDAANDEFRRRRPSEFAAQIADAKDDCRPFFVMNIDCAVALLELWAQFLPRVQPFYALNCNANPMLLRLMASHQSIGFSCSSGAEMINALHYVSADRVFGAFPCWTRSALRQAETCGVYTLCFDSERDLDRILANHSNARLLLRICVNPGATDANALFGAPLDEAVELLKLCVQLGLNCVGISLSTGPSTDDDCNVSSSSLFHFSSVYAFAIECSARLFRIGIDLGLRMDVLNIGDAFACPWSSASTETDESLAHFAEFCAEFNRSLDVHFPSDGIGNGLRIMATPGQFFARSPFSLVTNVIGKRSTDASAVTNNDFDAGKTAFHYQTNESYYGTFGCRMMVNTEPRCAPLFNDFDMDTEQNQCFYYGTVFGQSGFDDGSDTDIVQSVCHFRQLNIGDWLIWSNMGAYSFGNCGSLDDEFNDDDDSDGNEFGTPKAPPIFYFASQGNWESVCRKFDFAFLDEHQQQRRAAPLFASSADEYLSDSDSDGSVGEAMVHSDTEEMDGGGTEEYEFWPVGWPTKFND